MLQRRAYDHRLRALICESRDLGLAERFGVPKATASSWLQRGSRTVISATAFEQDADELRLRVAKLEQRLARVVAILRLLFVLLRVTGARLEDKRLASGEGKAELLAAIRRAVPTLRRSVILRLLGISPSRYHAWRKPLGLESGSSDPSSACPLDDLSSCPKSRPAQLTPFEVRAIRDLVTSEDYRHLSIRALALHAQRVKKVFAHPTTWMCLIRRRGWRRPLLRVHPPKPTLGIRATRPGEIIHIDVTLVRLLDGTKLYLHAILDNFSRRILAWKLAARLDPASTCEILTQATAELELIRGNSGEEPLAGAAGAAPAETMLLADSGVENVNGKVDDLLKVHPLRRVLAQVEVSFSNSMIEAWWRRLKHQWLFLHSLDSFAALEKLVAFYVEQHNTLMPHSAFQGQTPDEMYFGKGEGIPEELAERQAVAKEERVVTNRRLECDRCRSVLEPPSLGRDGEKVG